MPPISATKTQLVKALLAAAAWSGAVEPIRRVPYARHTDSFSSNAHRNPHARVQRAAVTRGSPRIGPKTVSAPVGLPLSNAFPFTPLPNTPPWRLVFAKWQECITGWYRQPSELLTSLSQGVRLGYVGARSGYVIRANHPSAFDPSAAAEIDAELLGELNKGRMAGPFTLAQVRELFPFFRTSPMAVVPKQGPEGGFRIIDDLTAGGDDAVNGGIPDDEANVSYQAFDDALRQARALLDQSGACWLGKIDWKAAFRQIAVHRDDWPLLGLSWRGQLFVRLVLPFGARSSPRQFMRFAAAFRGILLRSGVRHVIYYLDDFLLLAPSVAACSEAMQIMDKIAAELGVQLHPTKRDGPAQLITFLGIGIDTVAQQIFLPADKKTKLERLCRKLLDSGGASYAQLESLVGYLVFATRVIQPGRIMTGLFWEHMRRLREARAPRRAIFALPAMVLDDLRWWADRCTQWNGVSFLPPSAVSIQEPLLIQSDACTSLGAGAVFFDSIALQQDRPQPSAWYFLPWSALAENPNLGKCWSINELELAAVAVALETFGERLHCRSVVIHTDNTTTESALETGRASSPLLLRLLRGIHALAVRYDFRIHLATHLAGARNVRADAASRLSEQDTKTLDDLGLTGSRRLHPIVPEWFVSLVKAFPRHPHSSV